MSAGLDVITSCEELAFPFRKYPSEARELEAFARKKGRRVVATGINPGYLMDKLPLILTGVCEDVSAIRVTRVMYSGTRRTSFQDKIGTGLELAEFQRLIDQKVITGHVGLIESITMIVDALGWKVDSIFELPAEPVIADKELTTYTDISKDKIHKVVKPGQAAGLKSIAQATRGKKIVVNLEWISHAGVCEPYDAIEVEGTPNIHQRIEGGINGDIGTVSLMVNCIERLPSMSPGFYTMRDVNAPVAVGV